MRKITFEDDFTRPPSVPMIMRHPSPKSLASGRRTEIIWLCQSETRSWMAPQGLARWEAGGVPGMGTGLEVKVLRGARW